MKQTGDTPALLYRVAAMRRKMDADLWKRAVDFVNEACEPTCDLCPLEDGTIVWECIPFAPAYLYAEAYRKLGGEAIDEAESFAAGLWGVYEALCQDEVIREGEQINVCAPTDSAAFAGCVLAQHLGVPIYTVIGAEDKTRPYEKKRNTMIGARLLNEIAGSDHWENMRDVVSGCADEEDEMDTIATVWEELGYLLHPQSARTFYVADVYRNEAENRHKMVVIALASPYEKAIDVLDAILEYRVKDEDTAKKQLAIETSWPNEEIASMDAWQELIKQPG